MPGGHLGLTMLLAYLITATSVMGEDWQAAAFPVSEHNFGEVAVGTEISHAFPIHNPFKSALIIDSIASNCGCTSVDKTDLTIEPEGTVYVNASIDTQNYRGRRKAYVTLRVVKPVVAEVRIRVDAFIRADLVLYPGSIDFQDGFRGEIRQQKTTLMHAGESPLHIRSVSTNYPWLTASYKTTFQEGEKTNVELILTLQENAPAGFFRDQVLIHLTTDKDTVLPLIVSGIVSESVTVSPQSIHLGMIRGTDPVEVTLVVIGQEKIRVPNVRSQHWNIEYKPLETPKKAHLLRLKLRPKADVGKILRSAITVETAGADDVLLNVPVTASPSP